MEIKRKQNKIAAKNKNRKQNPKTNQKRKKLRASVRALKTFRATELETGLLTFKELY